MVQNVQQVTMKEMCDRREFEAWKEDQRKERDCDEHYPNREYSRHDYHCDHSSRHDDYYSDEDDDGWTQVTHRRRCLHDYY